MLNSRKKLNAKMKANPALEDQRKQNLKYKNERLEAKARALDELANQEIKQRAEANLAWEKNRLDALEQEKVKWYSHYEKPPCVVYDISDSELYSKILTLTESLDIGPYYEEFVSSWFFKGLDNSDRFRLVLRPNIAFEVSEVLRTVYYLSSRIYEHDEKMRVCATMLYVFCILKRA